MTVILLLLALACAPHAPAAAVVEAPAAALSVGVAPAMAPTPYTADQLREAMPVGTRMRYRVEEIGKPPVIAQTLVAAADTTTVTFAMQDFAEDGAPVGEAGTFTAHWVELRDHASFPADSTVIGLSSSYETPAGRFDTISYDVTLPADGGGTQLLRFQFAKDLPGPPVYMTVVVDGSAVHTMTLLERHSP